MYFIMIDQINGLPEDGLKPKNYISCTSYTLLTTWRRLWKKSCKHVCKMFDVLQNVTLKTPSRRRVQNVYIFFLLRLRTISWWLNGKYIQVLNTLMLLLATLFLFWFRYGTMKFSFSLFFELNDRNTLRVTAFPVLELLL